MCACTICAGVVWSSRSTQPCCNQASGQSGGGQSSGGGGEDVKPTCMTTEYYSESQGDCQPCPDGYKCSTWWGPCTQKSECKPSKTCPKGKFFDAGDCKQCDSGKTSKPGSTSRDDCVPECPADHYLSKEFGRCQRCAWPKSSPIGSESESDCRKKVCLAGEYLDEDTNGSPVCKSCEQGKTSSAGAERVSSCKSECVKGMFLNAQSECTHCGKDQCGVAMTTQSMGATSSSMCIEDVSIKKEFGELCDSHDQCRKMVNDAQIATCTCQIHCCGSLGMSTGCIECADDGDCAVCEAGYYLGWKYNIPTRNWCEKCPEGKTSKRGSTSSDDCGYGPNAAGDDCPNGRFDCVLGQCRGGICCSDLGSEPGTLSCAEDTGNGKSCDFGYYLGRSYYIGGHKCKKCADDKTTVDTGSTSDDDCVTKFVDGEACSINSQCASNSCKGGVCCNLQKDSPECTECDANKGYCAGCKSGFVLNTQEDSPDNGGDQKQNPFVCVACYPGTTSTDGARDAWNTWDYANNKLSFPPYGIKKVCLPDLKAGDVCDKKEQCLSYKCQKHCCKEFYKLCASCNENGLCEKCEAYSYMTEDGTCKLCGTDADGNFAYADAGSTDPSACFFKMSIDNGGKCRFDQAEACKSGDCRVNCCTESIDGCLKCGTNGACSEW